MRRPQKNLGEVAAEVEAVGASLSGVAKAWKLAAGLSGGELLHKRYRLVRRKGSRGFTLTWLGLNVNTGEDVAVHAVDLQEPGNSLASTPRGMDPGGKTGKRRELLRTVVMNLGFASQLDSPYVAGLMNVFIRGGRLYYVTNCIVSLEDHLANEKLYVADLKTLAFCMLRALAHMHQRGLVHGSVCTEDMFLHTTGFSDSLWRFKLAVTGLSMVQYRPDLIQLGIRGDEAVSPHAPGLAEPDPLQDVVELGKCLRDLVDRGKVRFKSRFPNKDPNFVQKQAEAELEGFICRLVRELPEGQEGGELPAGLSAADALNDPYLESVGNNLPVEGHQPELGNMENNSGLFDEDDFAEGMSPRKTGSYSPLPSCMSPHSKRSQLGAPSPMRSLLSTENDSAVGEEAGGGDGVGDSEGSESGEGEHSQKLSGRQTPPPNTLPPIK